MTDRLVATRDGWRTAGRALLAKLISELAYEELLVPAPTTPSGTADGPQRIGRGSPRRYSIATTSAVYTFLARRGTFDTWWIDVPSLRRAPISHVSSLAPAKPAVGPMSAAGPEPLQAAMAKVRRNGPPSAPPPPGIQAIPSFQGIPASDETGIAEPAEDPVRFVLDAKEILGWADYVVADIVPDLLATRLADARLAKRAAGDAGETAATLADAGYADLESLLPGHPCMAANKGRLSFSPADAAHYTPEAHASFRLLWVAAHPDIARHAPTDDTSRPPAVPKTPGPPWPQDPSARTEPPGSLELGLTNRALVDRELDSETRAAFAAVLTTRLGDTAGNDGARNDDDVGNYGDDAGGPAPTGDSGTSAEGGIYSASLRNLEYDPATDMRKRSGGPRDGRIFAGGETDATQYVWLPVHPWQWENVVEPLFAGEIEAGRLVLLGEAGDRYLPLQSVRTVTNVDRPGRLDVKLSLMIRNTLVWRGVSAADAAAGPAVSAWVEQVRANDPFLREVTRVVPVPEVAGASVAHAAFDALSGAPYRLHELLGVLWREPVEGLLFPGERARSSASLLAVGSDGRALVAELVTRSGLLARDWLAALLEALLPPLLHYFYAYGVAFTPHGENVVVVFDGAEVPRRIAVKDFGADVELVDGDFPERAGMPAAVRTHCRRWPAPILAHSIQSAIFAGHFRYFSVVVEDQLGVAEEEFWRLVRETVEGYQRRFPEYAGRFASADLLAPRFGRVCLNREHFGGAGFHDRAERDAGFDVIHGDVANPLYLVAQAESRRDDR